jgi:hypothetical protein
MLSGIMLSVAFFSVMLNVVIASVVVPLRTLLIELGIILSFYLSPFLFTEKKCGLKKTGKH